MTFCKEGFVRHTRIGFHFLPIVPLLLIFLPLAFSQTTPAGGNQGPAFQSQSVIRATSRLVVVDLVATSEHGAVTDLKQEDFTVLEDGVPQALTAFSFQRPAAHAQATAGLQNGVVTNAPAYRNASSFNIILLDAINTDFSSHAYAQDMLAKYLDSNPEIQPTAVFALDARLVMLHDFTTDAKALREVVGSFRPQGPAHIADVYSAASPFSRRGSFQVTQLGRDVTLQAMRFIARAMAGFPGRKNLIWISEGFPFNLFPDMTAADGVMVIDDYSRLVEKIADELMNAQIALYPIDAAGVTVNDRFSAHTAMISMAERTGGKTFYNRNDIETGVRTSIDDGAIYYSLAYVPKNRVWDKKFRKISVNVSRPGVKLQYREGYYAMAPENNDNAEAVSSSFSNALTLDTPSAAGVLFQAAVLPPSEKTQHKVIVNFGIDPHTIAFEKKGDDLEHGSVSCVVWAYANGKKGEPVRSEGPTLNAGLKQAEYQQMMKSYFPCQRSLTLKAGSYTLRLGVIDRTTNLMGTATASVSVP